MKLIRLSLRYSLIIFCAFLISSCNKKGIHTKEIKAIEDGLTPAVQVKGSLKNYSIHERMDHYNVPGVSIAILKNGEVRWAKGYGIANIKDSSKVDTNTLFQAGSISKPIAALAVLKLKEEDRLTLDANVNSYLKNWKIPSNEFTRDSAVTLRRLLTHTSGTTVHGFPGYNQSDTMPSITEVLEGEGNTPPVRVDTLPGSIWRYSGGGYTIMEKVVEDITSMPLEKYMAKKIFPSLGMDNSTFKQPLPDNKFQKASAAYDQKGEALKGLWNNYPEQAAAGLWTTPTDLAKYCSQIQKIRAGKTDGLLKPSSINEMLTKHKNNWGLGPNLKGAADSLIFQHGGKNAGFSNVMSCFAEKGSGVIIMTNADNGPRLNGEIVRSVSDYYNWELAKSKVVEKYDMPTSMLKKLIGRYESSIQESNRENIITTIRIKNNQLILSVEPFGITLEPFPTAIDTFLDPTRDLQITFKASTDNNGTTMKIGENIELVKTRNP